MNKLVSFILLLVFSFSAQAENATQILDKVKKSSTANFEDLQLKMLIQRKGETLTRELNIKKYSDKDVTKSLVKILKPKKIKDLGIYSEIKNGSEQQWIYLPSLRKSRRVLQGNRKSSFLDSDLNFEDFSADLYSGYNSKVIKQNKSAWMIESLPKSKDASYSKIVTTVSKKNYSVGSVKYYGEKGSLVKTMKASKFKKFGNILRATTVVVIAPKEKSKTTLNIVKLSTKKFPKAMVSKSKLEK